MANDGGMTGRLEDWFISQLAALTHNGQEVFKEVDHWRHQIASGQGGIESFERYAPFAFVKWQPGSKTTREGGYDLNQKLCMAVAIGQSSKEPGVARFGSEQKVGTSLMHSLVINLFDGKHPGNGFTCDNFYYVDDAESVDHPTRHGLELYFEANYLKS